jgi:hypothetical protein
MRRASGFLVLILLSAPTVRAQPLPPPPPAGKIVKDLWDAAYLDGHRAGFVRLTVEERTTGGQKIIRTTQEMNLSVRRGPDIAKISVQTGTEETPDGQITAVFMVQGLSQNVQQDLRGRVEGNELVVKAAGQQANFEKRIPWNPKVVSPLGELNLLRNRTPPPKPGDKFDYLTYNPIVNAIVKIHVEVEKFEEVTLNGGQQRAQLLRVSMTPDEIQSVQLPSQIVWYDGNFEARKSLANLPGVGFLATERTNQALARQPIAPQMLPDIMEQQSIKLAQRIPNAHNQPSLRYRISLNDPKPTTAFALDNRQKIVPPRVVTPENGNGGNSFELQVTAVRQPPSVRPTGAVEPGPEFTTNNFFITCDDNLVRQHAAKAVGVETDPWRKALRIENWVHDNMKVQNFANAMAPADEVAKTLTGDCTEYSMLAAAMCRAAGVPSRTAIGLVYVDAPSPRQPFFGFHMWTEVWINGEWIGIDATLNQRGIGPAHLKITDHSWDKTRSMTPLLPVMRVMMAQPSITVLGR